MSGRDLSFVCDFESDPLLNPLESDFTREKDSLQPYEHESCDDKVYFDPNGPSFVELIIEEYDGTSVSTKSNTTQHIFDNPPLKESRFLFEWPKDDCDIDVKNGYEPTKSHKSTNTENIAEQSTEWDPQHSSIMNPVIPIHSHSIVHTPGTTSTTSSSPQENTQTITIPKSAPGCASAKRIGFLEKMKAWKKDLLCSMNSIDKTVTSKAEECSREASDEIDKFKDTFMPTTEACRVILNPKYEGQCLGADMNKLTCEKLMSEVPNIWKETVISKVTPQMEEVITLSTDLLKECIESNEGRSAANAKIQNVTQNVTADGKPTAMDQDGIPQKDVRLQKFFEFYKGYRERSLRNRMEQLRQKIELESNLIVANACKDALTSQVLIQSEGIDGPTEDYHKFVEGQLPKVPVVAADSIKQRFSELVTKCVGEIEELQEEILEQNCNINVVVKKLHEMVINEEPKKKKLKTVSNATTEQADSDAEEEGEDLVMDHEEANETTNVEKKDLKLLVLPKMQTVKTLKDLCISKCVEFAEYLPEFPEGCFPEDIIQQLVQEIINAGKMDDSVIQRLLNASLRSVAFHNWRYLDNQSVSILLRRCPSLFHLDLTGCICLTDTGLVELTKMYSHHLSSLTLNGCYRISQLGPLHALTHLDCTGCPKLQSSAVAQILTGSSGNLLEKVILRGCGLVDDSAFTHLHTCAERNLLELDLIGCRKITNTTVKQLSNARLLAVLRLNSAGIDDHAVSFLQSSHNMRILELNSCSITELGFQHLLCNMWFPRLEQLRLPNSRSLTDKPSIDVERLPQKYFHLTHLDFSSCYSIGGQFLNPLGYACPNLISLDVSGCEEVMDEDIIQLLGKLSTRSGLESFTANQCRELTNASILAVIRSSKSKLNTLKVRNCNAITDDVIIELAAKCPNITELDLSSCEQLTDQALVNIGMGCRKLEKLWIGDLPEITGAGLRHLLPLQELRVLSLAHCGGLDDDCLERLAVNCQELNELDLSHCNKISLEVLQKGLRRWKKLEKLHLKGLVGMDHRGLVHKRLQILNLSWCKNLTDEALGVIASGCPQLSGIDLAWCDKITGAGVHRLAKNAETLKILNLRGCVQVPFIVVQFLTHAGKTVYR